MRLFALAVASLPTFLLLAPGCGDSTFSAQGDDAAAGDSSSQSDAISSDGAPSDTGASDVADDHSGPDAGRPFCTGSHDLCDDFEEPAGGWPASNWDSAQGATLMTFTTAESVSPSHSLHVTMGDGGTSPYVQKAVVKAITQLTCDVDLRVDAKPGASVAYIAEVAIASVSGDRVTVLIEADSSNNAWVIAPGTKISGTTSYFPQPRDPLVVGAWLHFKLTISNTGAVVVTTPMGMLSSSEVPLTVVRSYFELGLGLELATPTDGWVVAADNFVCDGT
jgi:hypothetical protein